jgi:hypothetical protein
MQRVLIVYAIVQLMTTAYGLAVIESIRPMVEEKLRDKGYIKNKNSLYTFSSTIENVAKGFIPCYYLGKAISILSDKGSVDKRVNEEIKSGHYISEEELNTLKAQEEEDNTDSIYKSPYDYAFEKPEKYTARKNDISLYDTYETPVDYIERVSKKEDDLELTPFQGGDKVVEHVVVKEEVTKSDIAKALSELSPNELEVLRNKITELARIKREKDFRLKLEKDVA